MLIDEIMCRWPMRSLSWLLETSRQSSFLKRMTQQQWTQLWAALFLAVLLPHQLLVSHCSISMCFHVYSLILNTALLQSQQICASHQWLLSAVKSDQLQHHYFETHRILQCHPCYCHCKLQQHPFLTRFILCEPQESTYLLICLMWCCHR